MMRSISLSRFSDGQAEPLLEVFLHVHSAAFEQVLNAFNFCFQIFELVVVILVLLFLHWNLLLKLVLLRCANDFTVVVNEATQRILLPNLLDLIGQVFNLVPNIVDTLAKSFAPSVFFF